MKMINVLVKVVLAGAAILACSGCQMFRKHSSIPATPPATSVGQSSGAVSGQQSPGSARSFNPAIPPATGIPSGHRPHAVSYSTLDNLFDVRSPVVSDATVLIVNHRSESGVIQISDRTIGVPDETGTLATMVLPPGESFALRDYGFGPTTMVRFVILDTNDNPAGYLWTSVRWPKRGLEWGKEMVWNIQKGDPLELPNGPQPVKFPTSSGSGASANTLSSQPGPVGSTTPTP